MKNDHPPGSSWYDKRLDKVFVKKKDGTVVEKDTESFAAYEEPFTPMEEFHTAQKVSSREKPSEALEREFKEEEEKIPAVLFVCRHCGSVDPGGPIKIFGRHCEICDRWWPLSDKHWERVKPKKKPLENVHISGVGAH